MYGRDLERETFFEKYKVDKFFKISGLKWETLTAIYNDYEKDEKFFVQCAMDLQSYITENLAHRVHSVQCRRKDGEHLIEKIIRKCGKEQLDKYRKIDETNYREIVRDLVGVRILLFTKEEWEGVFDDMLRLFPPEENGSFYEKDTYIDWTRLEQRPELPLEHTGRMRHVPDGKNVNIKDRANQILFRRDQTHD